MKHFKFFKKVSLLVVLIFVLFSTQIFVVNGSEAQKEKDSKKVKTVFLDNGAFYNELPADFDPINASDEELALYMFPERPTDKEQLEKWKKDVSGKWVKPEVTKLNIKGKSKPVKVNSNIALTICK